jgi:hypothetical protein
MYQNRLYAAEDLVIGNILESSVDDKLAITLT